MARTLKALIVAGLLSAIAVAPAEAGWTKNSTYGSGDGGYFEHWSNGSTVLTIKFDSKGHVVGVWVSELAKNPYGNPSPDDPSSGRKGDLATLQQLAKQSGGGKGVTTPFADTPLGRYLTQGGKGIVPKHNPGDVAFEGVEGGGGAGGGFTPNGGSAGDQIKRQAGKGGKDKGKGEDGSDLRPGEAGLFDDDMPGPPEIVNPNPVLTPAAGGALVLTGRIGASSDGNGTVVKSGGSAGFGEPDTMSTAGFSQGAPKLPTAAAPRARR